MVNYLVTLNKPYSVLASPYSPTTLRVILRFQGRMQQAHVVLTM